MAYQNFDLQFERGDPGYRVNARTPEGEASLPNFEVPAECQGTELEGAEAQRTCGERLYAALFRDRLRTLWERCSGRDSDGVPRRRRLRLHLDPTRDSHQELTHVPWELLHDGRDHLGLQRGTVVVRYIDEHVPTEPPAFRPPLRILVAQPDVEGMADLEDREMAKLVESWKRQAGVRLVPADPPAAHLLSSQLLDTRAHVLHFIGHGDFEQRTGEGYLVFEGRGHTGARLTGEDLARIARDLPTLRLVVLNACHTARHRAGRAAVNFSGVAAALSRSGVAAVVAMQFAVHNSLAEVFAETLHRRLAAGDSVEEAVAEGRTAVHGEAPDGLEWLAPVLFLRAEDGRLFVPRVPEDETRGADRERHPSVVEISEIDLEGDGAVVTGRKGPTSDGPRTTKINKNKFRGDGIVIIGEDRT